MSATTTLEEAQAAEHAAWLALWTRYGTTNRRCTERAELERIHEAARERVAQIKHAHHN